MKIIERKHKEAVDKLTAQRLRRANQEKARRRPIPYPLAPRQPPARAPRQPRPALPPPSPSHLTPRLIQSVGSQDHLPAVAVQAFPVEEEANEGDEIPPQPRASASCSTSSAAARPSPSPSRRQQRVLRGQEIDMRAASNAHRGRHASHQPLRHARGLRRRSGRSCVRRVERARRSAHLPTNGEGGRFPVRQYNVGSTGVCPVWCAACGVGEAGFPYRHPSEAEGAGGGDGGDDRRMPALRTHVFSRSSREMFNYLR